MEDRRISITVTLLLVVGIFTVMDFSVEMTGPAGAVTITVDDSGGEDYTKIQDAINASSNGDTIYVYTGTYIEHITVNKAISLTGESSISTIIDGGGSGDVVRITVDYVNISGFSIIGGGGFFWDAGIELVTVDNCNIFDNIITSNNEYGIYLSSSSDNHIYANNVSSNGIDGIYLSNADWNTISGNDISSNSQKGISLSSSYWNTIENNHVSPNNDYGIYLDSSQDNNITGNNITHNYQYGIYLDSSSNNEIYNNDVSQNSNWGFRLSSSNDNDIIGNNASNGNYGIRLLSSDENDIIGNTVLWNTETNIELGASMNNTITHNDINGSDYGIELSYSHGSNISYNTIRSSNMHGIYIHYSKICNISRNTMIEDGIFINGDLLEHWNSHEIDTTNTVDSKPVYYLKNQTGGTIPPGAGQVILANCTNIVINNQELNYGSVGIEIGFSSNNLIANNTVASNTWFGIYLSNSNANNITNNEVSGSYYAGIRISSSWNNVTDNTVNNCGYGIMLSSSNFSNVNNNEIYLNDKDGMYITSSTNNSISNNTISFSTDQGIHLSSSDGNNISVNTIYSNTDSGIYVSWSCFNNVYNNEISSNHFDGIYMHTYSHDNKFIGNYISDSDWMGFRLSKAERNLIEYNDVYTNQNTGIYVYDSAINNSIYHNNFIDNVNQVDDNTMGENHWDNGYPSGGNYWSDYTGGDGNSGPNQDIPGSDGIGDTPYTITFISKDYYPFMNPIKTPGPQILLMSPLNNSIIQPGVILDFFVSDVDLDSVNYSINGGVNAPLSNPYDISTVGWADGDYIVKINAKDMAKNHNSSWFFFTIDSTPPIIQLNSPGNNSIILEGIVIDFTIVEVNLGNTNYSINGGGDIPFSSPFDVSTTGWVDGDYTIQVNACDIANNINSVYFLFTVDNTKPTIHLNSPSNNTLIVTEIYLNLSVFDIHLLHVNYSLNDGGNIPLSSPFNISTSGWPDGNYQVQINAIDIAGNSNSSWYSFSIEFNPPIIILNNPGNNSIICDGTTLDFTILDNNLASANYSINGGGDLSFSDPFDIPTSGWADGDYTIQINALDSIGYSNSSWYFFTIDSISPFIHLNSPTNNSFISSGTVIDIIVTDLHLNTVEFSINGGPNNPLPDPYDISTSGFPDDNYMILITAIDMAGNANSSWYYFTIESNPPIIDINSPTNNSYVAIGTVLDFTVSDPSLLEANYSVNGGAPIPFSDPHNISTIGWQEGDYIILINASDSIGNVDSRWFSFTLDSGKPEIFLNSPLNNSVIRKGTVIDLSIVDFTLETVEYSINGGSTNPLLEPYNISTSGWVDGGYTVQIDAYDLAGFHNSSWFFFTLDSTPPSIALNSPVNNSIIPAGTVLDFAISDAHMGNVNYSINSGADTDLFDPYNIPSGGWSDGAYMIQINAVDDIGNRDSRWYNLTFDSTLPIIEFTTPGNNSIVQRGTNLHFEVLDTNLQYVNCSLNGGAELPMPLQFDMSTVVFDEGANSIQITAVDAAGNSNSALFVVIIDSTDPDITLTDPVNNVTITSGTILDISIVDPNLMEANYSINGGANTSFSEPYDISTGDWADGAYEIRINAEDLAGNRNSLHLHFTLDSIPPTIVLNTPANNSVIQGGTTLDFTINDTHLLNSNYSINGGTHVSIMEPFDITPDWIDGTYDIQINAMDTAGNIISTSFSFTLDSTPPTIFIDPLFNHSTIPVGTAIPLNISGEDLNIVSYSINEGEYIILNSPYTIDTTDWDDGSYKIATKVNDTTGNQAEIWFEIKVDATLPYILTTSPLHGSTGFETDGAITVTFSEDMDQTDIENHLSLSPETNFTYEWLSEDTLYISFETDNLAMGTTHNLTLDGAITDSHGNPMGTDFILTITTKFLDSDNDGTPDIEDDDDDNDGYPDNEDDFPLDETEWQDFDGDGKGDNADFDDDQDGHPDSEDAFPYDPGRWKEKEDPQSSGTFLILALVIAVIVVLLLVFMFVLRKKDEAIGIPEEEPTEFVLEEGEKAEPETEETAELEKEVPPGEVTDGDEVDKEEPYSEESEDEVSFEEFEIEEEPEEEEVAFEEFEEEQSTAKPPPPPAGFRKYSK